MRLEEQSSSRSAAEASEFSPASAEVVQAGSVFVEASFLVMSGNAFQESHVSIAGERSSLKPLKSPSG